MHSVSERANVRTARGVTIRERIVGYLSAWNETDARRRRELVARTWTEDGTYIDSQREGIGHAGIDSMLAATQRQFPFYRVPLAGSIQVQNGAVRFSWAAGDAPDGPFYRGGTDFVILAEDGRFESVAGFVDAGPVVLFDADSEVRRAG
jgi:hypothetical protein